jgi:protein-S-isoprenylcysteine O-methyltransferase Ste14
MTSDVPVQEKARVLCFPPLVGFALIGAGLAMHFAFPAQIFPTGWPQFAVGLPVLALAVLLWVAGVGTLRRSNTDFKFAKPTSEIVRHGPYRLTRNPIYVSALLQFLGIAFAVNALWMLALLPVLFLYLQFGVVLPEERYLERKFGEEYRRYEAQVRRWI